jgi:hypothetical protein
VDSLPSLKLPDLKINCIPDEVLRLIEIADVSIAD